ncbi:MAG: DM13 domain-containing protein [Candidatus Altimarinota bacterium]
MKKLLPVLILLALALGGFYWYTKSGVVLDEAAPVASNDTSSDSQASNNQRQLLQKAGMEKMIPDEPEKEKKLSAETQQKIDEMVKKAQMTVMTSEEKAQMEQEATMMMKGSEVTSSETMEMMTSEEMAENFISRQGLFTEIDLIHKGSGRALIYPQTAEGPILRLEDFSVTRGPDLHVYLSRNADVKTSADLGTYHDLGLLKSSKGNQNYQLPSNHEGFKSVVIWCQAFGVLFSSATLQP